ncbi:vacuolar iron transporter homolog 2-like [Typha latifolia]|uniref:vacuolar iron transporter homolog 2-like n=1 Tax=Typha latifolia TaxID=4733 RepID=UPI003C2CA9B2
MSFHLTSPIHAPAITQCLQTAILSAKTGLVSASVLILMIGEGYPTYDMLISIVVILLTDACRKAISEFVSVHEQNDIKMAEMKRESGDVENPTSEEERKVRLPSPLKAAGAAALAFVASGSLPLLAGGLVSPWAGRVGVVCLVTSLGLAVLGAIWAVLGGLNIPRSLFRALLGGLADMAIFYGVPWLFKVAFGFEAST